MTGQRIAATTAILASLAFSAPAQAALVVFSGADPSANFIAEGSDSAVAAAAFDAAAGVTTLIDFEAFDLGDLTNSLLIAPGVTLNTETDELNAIVDRSFCAPSLCGFNTTDGGFQFAQLFTHALTFNFATPITTFGAYFTGVQRATNRIVFDDGTSQVLAIPDIHSGAAFVGFTDFDRAISSITILTGDSESNDQIGVDDVRVGTATGPGTGPVSDAVPEPATWAMMILGIGVAGLTLRLRRGAMVA
ncbi:MAG TPA: PEPxxWA-CTERM sorting domain-containing protein [Phenylobacterium sp.]|nr:PEPxxWA-CTERM sorting domain-containing protein [Phenylobacterium sp.]